MKKIVLKLDLHDDKDKQKAMKTVSALQGIDSIGMDMKERKMTVIGSVDPVKTVMKLRKFCHTNVVSIGPAKEEKKEEPKKEEAKKEDAPKQPEGEAKEEKKEEKKEEEKEDAKKDGEKKEEEPKKKDEEEVKKGEEPKREVPPQPLAVPPQHHEHLPMMMMADQFSNYPPYKAYYNPYMTTHYYYVPNSQDQNPNSCSIM